MSEANQFHITNFMNISDKGHSVSTEQCCLGWAKRYNVDTGNRRCVALLVLLQSHYSITSSCFAFISYKKILILDWNFSTSPYSSSNFAARFWTILNRRRKFFQCTIKHLKHQTFSTFLHHFSLSLQLSLIWPFTFNFMKHRQ